MPITANGTEELSAQQTGTAWLALLIIDHPDLVEPIRVTSDAVVTTSGGHTYSPFPFDVILPDDVEGRAPQSQLRIDNVTQEIIAILRGLTTPPSLSIRIVRSVDPDVIERQWSGLEWRFSTFDIATITGTLTVNDLAMEEFPYVTFDGRWVGLWK